MITNRKSILFHANSIWNFLSFIQAYWQHDRMILFLFNIYLRIQKLTFLDHHCHLFNITWIFFGLSNSSCSIRFFDDGDDNEVDEYPMVYQFHSIRSQFEIVFRPFKYIIWNTSGPFSSYSMSIYIYKKPTNFLHPIPSYPLVKILLQLVHYPYHPKVRSIRPLGLFQEYEHIPAHTYYQEEQGAWYNKFQKYLKS